MLTDDEDVIVKVQCKWTGLACCIHASLNCKWPLKSKVFGPQPTQAAPHVSHTNIHPKPLFFDGRNIFLFLMPVQLKFLKTLIEIRYACVRLYG